MSTSSTVSSTLWAHLLRKDNPTASISSAPLPIAPIDKSGTSVRLLLHDTQATLEKFSEKVDKLLKGLEDARSKSQCKDQEWAEEVERSTKLVVDDAIKKCETKLQNTLMEPAQVSQITEIRQTITDNIERLHTKVDMIQMLHQTQNQALQTIQDQQGQILTALLPLLPLLQAVPLHIESGNNILKEIIQNTVANNDTLVNRVSMKRKSDLSCSPDPSISKRSRIESGFTTKQLPSPSRSRDAKSGSSPLVYAKYVSLPTPSASATPVMQLITNSLQRQSSRSSNLHLSGVRKQPVSTTPFNGVKLQNKAYAPVTTEVQLDVSLSRSSPKLVNRTSLVDKRSTATPINSNKTTFRPSFQSAPDRSRTSLVDRRPTATPINSNKITFRPSFQSAPDRSASFQNDVSSEAVRSSNFNAGSAKSSRSSIQVNPFALTCLSLQNRLVNDNTPDRSTRLQPYICQGLVTKPGKRFIPLVDDDSDDDC